MTRDDNKTFVRITQRNVYDEIQEIKQMLRDHVNSEDAKLDDIREHVIATNGKVKLARWIATTALSLAILAIGFAFR